MKFHRTGFTILALSIASMASAAPTFQVKSGSAVLELNSTFASSLDSCKLERIKPALLKTRSDGVTRLTLFLASGVVDTGQAAGELQLRGGMSIDCTSGQSLDLHNMNMDTSSQPPLVSAAVAINGELSKRINIFSLNDNLSVEPAGGRRLEIEEFKVLLTQEGASLLSGELGVNVSPGDEIGTGSGRFKLRHDYKTQN